MKNKYASDDRCEVRVKQRMFLAQFLASMEKFVLQSVSKCMEGGPRKSYLHVANWEINVPNVVITSTIIDEIQTIHEFSKLWEHNVNP